MNEYNPDSVLQQEWDNLPTSCLCGRTESCGVCDGTINRARRMLVTIAEAADFQIYYKVRYGPLQGERKPVNYDAVMERVEY